MPEKDPNRNWDIASGSMQITFYRLSFDYYPFHPAGGERRGWFRYTDNTGTRNPWVQKLFAAFREDAVKIRKVCGSPLPSPSTSTTKIPVGSLSGSAHPSPSHSPAASATPSPARSPGQHPRHQHHQQQQQPQQKTTRLLESCIVAKVEDLTIYMVSTPGTRRSGHQKFLVSDKKQLHLPADMSVVHMEYTEYFFPDGIDYPVPHPNLYILINPVKVTVDFLTLLWSQYFLFTLAQNVVLDTSVAGPNEHIDIKLEALMPRIVLPSEVKAENQPERPDAVQIQVSKLTASNCRTDGKLMRQDLRKALDLFYASHLFHTADFPNDCLPHRLTPWQLENHACGKDNPYLNKGVKSLLEHDLNLLQGPEAAASHTLSANSLKMDAFCDVWGMHLEQVWVEFLGVQNFRNRPVPCVEAFPLTLWFGLTQIPSGLGNASPRLSIQSNATLRSEHRGSNSESPLLVRSDEMPAAGERRPAHLPLSDRESFEDCHSLQSEELNLQQPQADSTMFLLSHFAGKMRVQVNHYQYVFLLGCLESLSKFQTELSADLALWGSTRTSITHLPLDFHEVELAIICPYQMHQRTFSDDFSPLLPNFAEVFSTTGAGGGGAGGKIGDGGGSLLDMTLTPEPVINGGGLEVTTDRGMPFDNNNVIPVLPVDHLGDTTTITTSAVTLSRKAHSSSDVQNFTHTNTDSSSIDCPHTRSFTSEPKSLQMSLSAGTDSGISLDPRSLRPLGKGSKGADVKKAFSSAFSNFTDRLKNTFDDNISDDLDSMSVKTDTSDSDDFEQLSLDDADEVPAFVHEGRSDTGSNADTGSDMETSSIYADSSTTKGREMVSVILLKLDDFEGLLQLSDAGIFFCAQVAQFQLHQPGNVGYDDFYGKFASPKGFLQDEVRLDRDGPPKFPLRIRYYLPAVPPPAIPPPAHSNAPHPPVPQTSAFPPPLPAPAGSFKSAASATGAEPTYLTMKLENYSLQFKMSGAMCMSEFSENERPASLVMPMSVSIKNLFLVLEEDRPAASPSAAQTPPTNCHIEQLHIRRGSDGIYYLSSGSSGEASMSTEDNTDTMMEARGLHTPSSHSSLALLTQTQAENTQLKNSCEELHRANKLYEEQILLMRDRIRELESQTQRLQQAQQQQQRPSPAPSPQSKVRSHSINSLSRNSASAAAAASPGRTSHSEAGPGGGGGGGLSAVLEIENVKLQDRVLQLEDQLTLSLKEKDSLVSTLQFLQEELIQSERRSRSLSAV